MRTGLPQILQIHRERIKDGYEGAYLEIEADTARLCAELGCPHPYLGIESLTGPKEVWFFNGYESWAEQKQVVDDYAKNTRLLAALEKNSKRKATLTEQPVSVFANYRQDLSRGRPWALGQGRFLVIVVIKNHREVSGTVFEAADGTRFVVMSAETRGEADVMATSTGPEPTVFAVRPSWSFPAGEWIARDSEFWRRPGPPRM
jgi:hypothetical protein